MSLAFFLATLLLLAIPPVRRLVGFSFKDWSDWLFLLVGCVLAESFIDHLISAIQAFQK